MIGGGEGATGAGQQAATAWNTVDYCVSYVETGIRYRIVRMEILKKLKSLINCFK